MGLVAEVVSALAAVGALVAAVWAGITAKRLYLIEAERDRMEMVRERRRGAARVSAWVCTHFANEGSVSGSRRDGILIANLGECPIYDVEVSSTNKLGQEQALLKQNVLPPGQYFVASTNDAYQWAFPDQVESLEGTLRPITKKAEWRVTRMSFADADGLRWARDDKGRLSEES